VAAGVIALAAGAVLRWLPRDAVGDAERPAPVPATAPAPALTARQTA